MAAGQIVLSWPDERLLGSNSWNRFGPCVTILLRKVLSGCAPERCLWFGFLILSVKLLSFGRCSVCCIRLLPAIGRVSTCPVFPGVKLSSCEIGWLLGLNSLVG